MTVASDTNRSGPYTGNGVTTAFDYAFRIVDEAHIQVVRAEGGVETILTLTTHYTVTGVGDAGGGQVVMVTAPTADQTVTCLLNVPFTQEVDLENQGAFLAETVENALDLAVMRAQQLQEQIDRAILIPASSDDPGALDDLPALILRLGVSAAEIDTVAGIAANVTTVAGVAANVTTVAGIAADVTSVAGNAANVTTVAGIAADVTSVAGIAADVTSVAGVAADVVAVQDIAADVTAVAAVDGEVTTVAGIAANVTTVAGVAANVTTVAGIAADVTSVAGIAANVTTVAGIAADVTSVAGIAADVTSVAGIAANVTTVAGVAANVTTVAGIAANVTTVAGVSADVTTVASNIAEVLAADDNAAIATTKAAEAAASAALAAAAVAGSLVPIGNWDASAGTFPGGGTAQAGAFYYVSVAGTVDSVYFDIGDAIFSKVNNASTTTYAANWQKVQGYIGSDEIVTALGYTPATAAQGALADTAVQPGGDIGAATATSITFSDSTKFGSAVSLGSRNILINGDFRINQRGYVSAATLASAAYGHDRWKAGASGGNYSFTQLNNSTMITIVAGKSLIHVVENKNVVGGSYVLSWTGTAVARYAVDSATPAGTFAVSPILITGQTAGTTMSVEFTGADAVGTSSVATNTGTLGLAQLELGSVATPFERRQYGHELALCQRYYAQDLGAFYFVQGLVTAQAMHTTTFPVEMRAAPTFVAYNTNDNTANQAYSASGVRTVAYLGTTSKRVVSYLSAFTAGSNHTSYWKATAEL